MYCDKCTKFNAKTKWNRNEQYLDKKGNKINGIIRFKIDGIKDHSMSEKHRDSLQKEHQSKTLVKVVVNMFQNAYQDIIRLMKLTLFITQEKIAINKFPKFCHFIKDLGFKLTNSDLYMSRYGYLEILKCFDHNIKKQQLKRIQNSNFYSIVIDESTDLVFSKELIIYIKYYDDKLSEIRTEFLCLIKLDNFTGRGIFDILISKIQHIGFIYLYFRVSQRIWVDPREDGRIWVG